MKTKKLVSQIEKFLQIPLKFLFILIVFTIIAFIYNRTFGIIVGTAIVLYSGTVLIMYFHYKPTIMSQLMSFAFEQGQIQKELLKELAVPYALIDMGGMILWHNGEFEKMIGNGKLDREISHYVPDLSQDMFPTVENDINEFFMEFEECQYRVQFRLIQADISLMDGTEREEELMRDFDNAYANSLVVVYFFDETNYRRLLQENKEQKLVSALIYIDNYEEVLETMDEVRQPLLLALVERKINKYIMDIEGIIKKPEKDKYVIVFQRKYLAQLQANKFSILDEIRSINVGNDLPITLSMSIGTGSNSYQECYEYARVAMDMALGRGGDQVVIKEGEKISYYGGQSRMLEKNTRVKARVKAHALQGFIEAKEKVVIMGHHLPDVDSLGSALGIYKLAKA